ncbi:MAG: thioredoxin domain-containing protein [Patescibacteria group bacterium]|jgi:protein-disulfide isomerase
MNIKKHQSTIILISTVILVIAGIAGLIIWSVKQGNSVNGIVNPNDPVLGKDTAKVKIVEYSDFQCPACMKMYNFLKQAETEFGDDLSIQFKDFPLTSLHPNAMISAEAAQCAFQQNKFWEYYNTLYDRQTTWSPERDPSNLLKNYAQELGLNTAQFNQCLDNHEQQATVKADMKIATDLGINQTPTLYINDKEYSGVSTYESLAKEIKAQLEK